MRIAQLYKAVKQPYTYMGACRHKVRQATKTKY